MRFLSNSSCFTGRTRKLFAAVAFAGTLILSGCTKPAINITQPEEPTLSYMKATIDSSERKFIGPIKIPPPRGKEPLIQIPSEVVFVNRGQTKMPTEDLDDAFVRHSATYTLFISKSTGIITISEKKSKHQIGQYWSLFESINGHESRTKWQQQLDSLLVLEVARPDFPQEVLDNGISPNIFLISNGRDIEIFYYDLNLQAYTGSIAVFDRLKKDRVTSRPSIGFTQPVRLDSIEILLSTFSAVSGTPVACLTKFELTRSPKSVSSKCYP